MKTVVYYFTGTGNSLELASKLAKMLGADLIPVAALIGKEKELDLSYEKVGLVYPTYMYRPPIIIAEFIKKLRGAEYIFAVADNGGDPGDVLPRTAKLLARQGLRLDAGFTVRLPDNYIPFGGPPGSSKQAEMFAQADVQLKEIVETVNHASAHAWKKPSWFKTKIFPALWYGIGYWAIPKYDNNFWVTDKCTGCAACAKICPVDNITMENKRPVWHNNCQQCLACLQWCKPEAIELGKKSVGITRYKNPRIKRKEIILQKNLPTCALRASR